jgi:hypothetical protein
MSRLPDFLIIGAMKSATSTLHEQLAVQPGILMSEPKELDFFNNEAIYARGMDWYCSHFAAAAAADLCGESSTSYTKLPTYPHTVKRLHAALPRVKLVYMMRHPIDRLVSHYLHERLERRMQMPIDEAVERHPELIAYGCYSQQLEPFLDAYGPENLLPIFFERFVTHGPEQLERVCRFVGYEGQPRWHEAVAVRNVSSQRLRDSRLRDAIVYAPVLRTIRTKLIPKSWRERVKRFWQFTERPQLSESSIRRLERVFDEDLARLGRWLDLDLSCTRYCEIARTMIPVWSGTPALLAP